MRTTRLVATLCCMAIACLPATGLAKDKGDIGKREYESNCAACHGTKGKGDGPMAGIITQRVPDLTVLSKNNGGVFPLARVYSVIEGEAEVTGHGSRDMPVWGRDYKIKAAEYYIDVPYDDEAFVRARILGLAEYLSRLQQK